MRRGVCLDDGVTSSKCDVGQRANVRLDNLVHFVAEWRYHRGVQVQVQVTEGRI